MCGIFGIWNANSLEKISQISGIIIDGLRSVEYRGYDSAGICILSGNQVELYEKSPGKLEEALVKRVNDIHNTIPDNGGPKSGELEGRFVGIGHTRWATHGRASEENAHPHRSDPENSFFVVHNGTIDNFHIHKKALMEKGHVFESETDTELVAKYCLEIYRENNGNITFLDIVKAVTSKLQGTSSFVFISPKFPDEMIAVNRGLSLVLGIRNAENLDLQVDTDKECRYLNLNQKNSVVVASALQSISKDINQVFCCETGDIIRVGKDRVEIYNNASSSNKFNPIDATLNVSNKGKYPHFMIKEIYEQPEAIERLVSGRVDFEKYLVTLTELDQHKDEILSADRFLFVACGTSYHAACATVAIFQEVTSKPASCVLASTFLDERTVIRSGKDVVILISQSGETADTLAALRYCKQKGVMTITVTNTEYNQMSREATCNIYIKAGVEKGVASTKAYTSQFLCNVLMALYINQHQARENPASNEENDKLKARREEIINGIRDLPGKVKECLEVETKKIAERLRDSKSIFCLGRGYHIAAAYEGALKVKEVSYVHTEGNSAAELKHGPLALVDSNMPILFIVSKDRCFESSMNALNQILARNGKPILITNEKLDEFEGRCEMLVVPKTVDCLQGVISIIPLQLIAYDMSLLKGNDPDCPRNLAKSVTVE